MVVLNSSETIADLLDKRSAIYSDKVTAVDYVCSAGANATLCPVPRNSLKHH